MRHPGAVLACCLCVSSGLLAAGGCTAFDAASAPNDAGTVDAVADGASDGAVPAPVDGGSPCRGGGNFTLCDDFDDPGAIVFASDKWTRFETDSHPETTTESPLSAPRALRVAMNGAPDGMKRRLQRDLGLVSGFSLSLDVRVGSCADCELFSIDAFDGPSYVGGPSLRIVSGNVELALGFQINATPLKLAADGAWHHVVMTASTNAVSIEVDGKAWSHTGASVPAPTASIDTVAFYLGVIPQGASTNVLVDYDNVALSTSR